MLPTTKYQTTGVVSVLIGGQSVTTGTTNRSEARRIAKLAVELSPLIQTYGLGKAPAVVDAIIDFHQWLLVAREPRTAADLLIGIKAWAQNMDVMQLPINRITQDHIDKWVNEKRTDIKAGTRRNRLSVLRSFFNFAIVKRYVAESPCQSVKIKAGLMTHEQKETKPRSIVLNVDYNAIIKYLDKEIVALEKTIKELNKSPKALRFQTKLSNANFWRVAVVLGRVTGLRMGDIANLEWKSFTKTGIVVWTDKRDKRVELDYGKEILDPDAMQDAIGLIPCEDDRYCFPAQRGAHHSKLSVYFKRICLAAGVTGNSFHDLRATYLTEFVKSGRTIEHAAKAAGHSNTATTKGYVKD